MISGQFLTDKKCQTYVIIELYGLPADTKRKNKTKLAQNTYMNTCFSDETFHFNKVFQAMKGSVFCLRLRSLTSDKRLSGCTKEPVSPAIFYSFVSSVGLDLVGFDKLYKFRSVDKVNKGSNRIWMILEIFKAIIFKVISVKFR